MKKNTDSDNKLAQLSKTIPSKNELLKLAEREANLQEAIRWLAQAEKNIDEMKKHQRFKQPHSRDEASKDLKQALKGIAVLEENDDYQQPSQLTKRIKKLFDRLFKDASKKTKQSNELLAKPDAPIQNNIPTALAIPLGFLICIMGLAGMVINFKRFELPERQTYKDALNKWQPVLNTREAMRTPREIKRFLNLSRYLTLRVNSTQYLKWSWPKRTVARIWDAKPWADAHNVNDDVIIALITLLATRPKYIQGEDKIRKFLLNPIKFLTDHQVGTFETDDMYMQAINEALNVLPTNSSSPPWGDRDVDEFFKANNEFKTR